MLDQIKHSISIFILIPLISALGIYLTFKLKFLQITSLPRAWKFFIHDRDPHQSSNSFSAVAAVLGGNLGTGNIAGIAVALSMGGPGSLFWMWIMASLGAILKFTGTVLGVLYRRKDNRGEFVGGPMYYLCDAVKSPLLASLFCVFTIFSALSVGNLVQMNSLALPLTQMGVPLWATGLVMAVLVALVILGGLERFSHTVSKVVPIMAIFYTLSCSYILCSYASELIPALQLIIKAAFSPVSFAGGMAGFTVIEGLRAGFDRGLFATDVGAGLAPIIHSSVESKTSRLKTAFTQGIISTLSPLIVMIVCTLTGLVLMTTGAWSLTGLESTNICIEAFKIGFNSSFAGHLVTLTLFFFAFTTILTWSFCADKAVEFLFSTKFIVIFQWIFIGMIPFGCYLKVSIVWSVADIFMNGMLIINLLGLLYLAPHLIRKVRKSHFFSSRFKKNSSLNQPNKIVI